MLYKDRVKNLNIQITNKLTIHSTLYRRNETKSKDKTATKSIAKSTCPVQVAINR